MSTHPLTHPDGRYPVVASPSELPPGSGGIEVRASVTRWQERSTLAPQVGVDGAPALYGWGQAVVVVPPGDHLVEVQYIEPKDSAAVAVRAGEVVSLTYHVSSYRPRELRPAGPPPPAVWPSRVRSAIAKLLGFCAAVMVVVAVMIEVGAPLSPFQLVCLVGYSLATPAFVWFMVTEIRARERAAAGRDRQRRKPSQHEGATAPVMLDRYELPPTLPEGFGAVIVGFRFDSYVHVGAGALPVEVFDDRWNYDIWIGPPLVTVDGVDTSAGWATWWYPLSPGPHDIEVAAPAPALHRVSVQAGSTVSLNYFATIRIRKDETDTVVTEHTSTGNLSPA